jgi:hypothetical protein
MISSSTLGESIFLHPLEFTYPDTRKDERLQGAQPACRTRCTQPQTRSLLPVGRADHCYRQGTRWNNGPFTANLDYYSDFVSASVSARLTFASFVPKMAKVDPHYLLASSLFKIP